MAATNHERVGKAIELLREGLAPVVERGRRCQHQLQLAEAARRTVVLSRRRPPAARRLAVGNRLRANGFRWSPSMKDGFLESCP